MTPPSKDISAKSRRLIPLPSTPQPEGLRRVSFCLPDDPEWAAVFWGHLFKMTMWFEWERDKDKSGKDLARYWMKILNNARMSWFGLHIPECGEPEKFCVDYPPNADFIEWEPQNPFTEPSYIPTGFQDVPFTVVKESDAALILLGLQPGDVITDLTRFPNGSLPTIIPPDGFARFRVNFTSPAEVELHFVQIPTGGIVSIQLDGNILTTEILDLNKDLVSIPIETVTEMSWERTYDDTAEHFLDVTFLPYVNDQVPYVYYGGGLRRVTLCGENVPIMGDFDVRQNSENPCTLEKKNSSGEWVAFANLRLCPPDIKVGSNGTVLLFDSGSGTYQPPTVDETYDPRNQVTTPSTQPNTKCIAAANAAQAYQELHKQLVSTYSTNFTVWGLGTTLGTLTGVIFGVFVPAALIMPLALGILQAVTNAISTHFNTTVQYRLRCIISNHLNEDGTLQVGGFNAILAEVFSDGRPIFLALWYYMQVTGEVGLNNALRVQATTSDDCGCNTCGEVYAGFENSGGITPSGGAWYTCAEVVDGFRFGYGRTSTAQTYTAYDGLNNPGGGVVLNSGGVNNGKCWQGYTVYEPYGINNNIVYAAQWLFRFAASCTVTQVSFWYRISANVTYKMGVIRLYDANKNLIKEQSVTVQPSTTWTQYVLDGAYSNVKYVFFMCYAYQATTYLDELRINAIGGQ